MQYMQRQQPLTRAERELKDKQRAEREAEMRVRNNRLGLFLFQASWIMVFVALIVVNWQMRFSPEWMAEGTQRPDAILPTIATIALLVSTYFARSAWQAVRDDRHAPFMREWLYAIGLGAAFFVIMLTQFFALVPGGGQHISVYRLMIGYHAIHALVIGGMMLQVWRFGARYHAGNTWAVEASTKLWYFVTVAWLMFYVVLYII